MTAALYVRWFSELSIGDVGLVGGKNASLGEMYRELVPLGVPVPNGFAVTAAAFRDALERVGAWPQLHAELDGLDKSDVVALARAGRRCREIVYGAGLTPEMEAEILAAYRRLRGRIWRGAVRGGSLLGHGRGPADRELRRPARHLPQRARRAGTAGRGPPLPGLAVHRPGDLLPDRPGLRPFQVSLSVGCRRWSAPISPAPGSCSRSTPRPASRTRYSSPAPGAWARTWCRVPSTSTSSMSTSRPTAPAAAACCAACLGSKKVKMVYAEGRTREPVSTRSTSAEERRRFCLDDEQVLALAGHAIRIEDHYGAKAGRAMPMDMEWALDGVDGRLYIVQARPETVASQRRGRHRSRSTPSAAAGPCWLPAAPSAPRRPTGPARLIVDARRSSAFRDGEVLVADTTTPDWEPVMKRAAAIVTNRGGRTCHAAIVARELGIPAVVGAEAPRAPSRTGPWSPFPAPRATSAGSTRARCRSRSPTIDLAAHRAAADRDDDQSGQPGAGIRPRRTCRPTAWALRGWSSSSRNTSRPIRWRCCIPSTSKDEDRARAIAGHVRRLAFGARVLHHSPGGGRRHHRRRASGRGR